MRNYDLEFLKRFSMVIALLVTITLGLILLAAYIHTRIPPEVSPTAAKRTEQRISPTGAVYAGSTGAAAQAAAAPVPASSRSLGARAGQVQERLHPPASGVVLVIPDQVIGGMSGV